ncbi:7TM protein involved in diverse intracellular signaling [Lutibacter oceani]|uniref:7TM protein involved in diverse intracellular signaling n=1 Tax=Lutibacter oceani TaxID=1853311 RepID=A0A3D9S4V4_9FLAO|nr:histidine kinase [Lutibacter oceani]REE83592.1 7TM protein involved in diverse intracellular signaling [Lutibacter oceani]
MLLDFHSEIYSWIRGGLFVLFVYHLLIFFQNRSKLYLYYSLYLLALTIYLLSHIATGKVSEFYNYINFSIQFLAYAAYVLFARELLDTRTYLIKWDRYFVIETKVLLILFPTFILIQVLLGYEFQIKAFTLVAPILTIFTLISYYIIYTRIKDNFSSYFVAGSLIYLLLANISFLELFVGLEFFTDFGLQPMFFVYLGAMLQCIIFSIIIGFTIKRIEQKSKNAEVRLAIKLKEMEELKMTALQSQMNPHFLFNSLNSINNFVLKNEVEKASDYITKFSKLIRVILNSSSSPTSTLSDELGILALYIKLEKMRVTGGFKYTVKVDENLNLDKIKVPPMFLQPFIENSIWHGIMKKEGEKMINLTIKEDNGNVLCIVLDNGIGINKAKELSHMSQKRKFFGAEATENRIRMLYQNKDVHIVTKDISSNTTTGTQVSIKFPLL